MANWPLETANRNMGNNVFVDNGAMENLCQIIEATGEALDAWRNEVSHNYSIETGTRLHDSLCQVYRNACKLAAWMAGHMEDYDEEETRRAFEVGREFLQRHCEVMLDPILTAEEEEEEELPF